MFSGEVEGILSSGRLYLDSIFVFFNWGNLFHMLLLLTLDLLSRQAEASDWLGRGLRRP